MKIFNFLRKNLISFLVVALSVVMFFSVAAFCWFAQSNGFSTNFKSSTATAYFAGGDGSRKEPYQITAPVHLYNLAWLQYLGYFNLRNGFNNGRAQSYFKLTADIDMRGYILPPIGTEKYPFIGNFNGDGFAVTNLTVSNGFNDFNGKIYPVNAVFDKKENNGILYYFSAETTSTSAASFLGMFGVTGNYNNTVTNSYANTNSNTVIRPVTDKLAEGAVPKENEFYMSEMSVEGFYLDYVKVKSHANTALVGFIAGYVAGDVKNAGVYQSRIEFENTATAKTGDSISAYGLVGNYDSNSVAWEDDPDSTGGDGGWGGSIDMRTLARRVNYMMSSADMTTFLVTTAAFKNDNYNFYAVSKRTNNFVFNYNYNPYGSFTDIQAELLGGTFDIDGTSSTFTNYTFLPLNIDLNGMGLTKKENGKTVENETEYTNKYSDKTIKKMYSLSAPFKERSDEDTLSGAARNINKEYFEKTSEIVSSGNTGYIVGLGTGTYGALALNVTKRTAAKSIKNSFKSGTSSYADSEFAMLTYVKDSGFLFIEDSFNKNDTVNRPTGTPYVSLADSGLHKDADGDYHYDSVRNNSNFDRYMGIGTGNENLYGLMFNNANNFGYDDANTIRGVVEHNGKKLVTGAVNFNTAKNGIITAIVGTYKVSDNKQGLFGVYRVKSGGLPAAGSANWKNSLIKTEKIYKENDVYVIQSGSKYYLYDNTGNETELSSAPSIVKDSNLVYDKSWYEKNVPACHACYVEIPVPAGDYVLITEAEQNGYLMYLDVGSAGNTGTQQHAVSMVDFVNYCDTNTLKEYIAVNNGKYPQFDDITAKISAVTAGAYVSFRRKSTAGATFPESKSLLGFVSSSGLTIGFTPTGSGKVDQEAENVWQNSG